VQLQRMIPIDLTLEANKRYHLEYIDNQTG